MNLLIYFLLAVMISFVGSLQPGPVNMAVFYHSVNQRYQTAIAVAIGGSLPEVLFSFVAFKLLPIISEHLPVVHQFSSAINSILIIIGLVLMLGKQNRTEEVVFSSEKGFLSGLLLAFLNPQLLVFWIGILTGLSIYQIQIKSIDGQLIFAIGTAVGALIVHLLVMLSVKRYQNSQWVDWLKKYSLKLIGAILIILGLTHLLSS
ncbi:MAG: LysE family translocator [Bacteroidia bacterium]|jgi:threonine/homoserine/homoserine lactone efflux protein|nr:LysE family translocator [Bacteroidia bacterium]